MANDRVTQLPVEGVIAPDAGKARTTQAPVEAIIAPNAGKARLSSVVIESLASWVNSGVVTQLPVEVVRSQPVGGATFRVVIVGL